MQYYILAEARLLIADPENWCNGRFAVGKTGRTLASGSPRAAKHCAVSAILFAARRLVSNKWQADQIADSTMLMIAPPGSDVRTAEKYIWSVNDLQGHAAVMDLFDTVLAVS